MVWCSLIPVTSLKRETPCSLTNRWMRGSGQFRFWPFSSFNMHRLSEVRLARGEGGGGIPLNNGPIAPQALGFCNLSVTLHTENVWMWIWKKNICCGYIPLWREKLAAFSRCSFQLSFTKTLEKYFVPIKTQIFDDEKCGWRFSFDNLERVNWVFMGLV